MGAAMNRVWTLLLAVLLAACTPRAPELRIGSAPPSILLPTARTTVADGRARYREIYCAVRAERGTTLPFDRPCDTGAALRQVPGEGSPTGRPVALGQSTAGYTVVFVPGLLAECVASQSTLFGDARANIEAQGYRTAYIQTGGRQSSEINAAIIRDAIRAMPADSRLILVTHSKGTVDTLVALSEYPDLADKVVAQVSVAGAVNGSPLADLVPNWVAELAEQMPMAECAKDNGVAAADSLRRAERLAWLATHSWPASVHTYSLVAVAGPDNVSAMLRPFYRTLAGTDPANDSQVVASDAVVPASTLLGYANADHVAVAMPFSGLVAATLMTQNDFPRAVLLEAAIRYVEEDVGQVSATAAHPQARRR
jgi:hypothetical protein